MHDYTVTDRKTGETTKLVAPNRDAALKSYVKRRLIVTRVRNAPDALPTAPPPGTPFELPGERPDGAVG